VRGLTITRDTPTITFVNRNLERLRGFDLFMRALPRILQQHPSVRVMIVGDNDSGYGGVHASGRPLRQVLLEELAGQLDLERIHFLGRIPHPQLIGLLQASWVHVYLSYPFVLGWSLLEAMACGTPVAAYNAPSPLDVVEDGVTGAIAGTLEEAVARASTLNRDAVCKGSMKFSWGNCAEMFESWLVPCGTMRPPRNSSQFAVALPR